MIPTDTNLIKNWWNPKIKISPKDRLDSVLGGNCDQLLVKKQEPWYKEDATTNYGLLIDKSKGELHRKFDKFEVLQELEWISQKFDLIS